MTRSETSPTVADPPPDWAAAAAAGLACPTCEYDLHGLATPRCPECGQTFRWADLIEAKRAGPRWLFERPGPRRGWAFLQTYARTGLPWHFWRRVTRESPVRLGRLIVYWFLVSLPLVWVALATTPVLVLGLAQQNLAIRAQYATARRLPTSRPLPPPSQIDARCPAPWTVAFARQAAGTVAREVGPARVAAAAVPILWPWLTAAALLLAFRRPLRRAGGSAADVVRASVYGCDFGLLAIAVAGAFYSVRDLGTVANDALNAAFRADLFGRDAPLVGLMVVASATLATVRMTFAAARYLRLGRPLLTVLAAQAIVVTTATATLVLILPRH